jgi:flagellar hook-associated protein 1 FlgK
MSTLNSVLNTALNSMNANQLALSIASNNIANANNPDYTRQRLLTAPAGPDGGQWHVGTGVAVVGIEAVRDRLVDTRLRNEFSAKSGADTLASRLGNVESLFNDANGSGLLKPITDFFNSFQTLSQDPASIPLREQVRSAAGTLVNALHARNTDLLNIKASADTAIASDVTEVNRLTTQIADLTRQIKVQEVDSPANDLRDHRASLVKQLSQYIEVNEIDSTDYQLSTKDNHLLVMNDAAQSVSATDLSASSGAGSLGAELQVRDSYVPKYAAALDQLAYEIANKVNSIHSSGYNLNGDTNVTFFSPLGSVSGSAQLISMSADVSADARNIAASSQPTGNDNGTAMALGNLLTAQVFSGGSVTDQYGALVYTVGSDSANAQSESTDHQALLTQLQNRRQSISGVSMDEETVQMLQLQRGYQASAKLIMTIDELLQVALGLGAH